MTLSGVATLLVEQFVPDMRQMYVFKNYKQSGSYRSYNKFVPPYLQGRPKQVILHCLDRKSRSSKFPAQAITEVKKGTFELTKDSGGKHTVNFEDSTGQFPSCTCKDWQRWHLPCKHFFAVFHNYSQWNWEALPQQYRESSYLSQDADAIDEYLTRRTAQPPLTHQVSPDASQTSLTDGEFPDGSDDTISQAPATPCAAPTSEIPTSSKVRRTIFYNM